MKGVKSLKKLGLARGAKKILDNPIAGTLFDLAPIPGKKFI